MFSIVRGDSVFMIDLQIRFVTSLKFVQDTLTQLLYNLYYSLVLMQQLYNSHPIFPL